MDINKVFINLWYRSQLRIPTKRSNSMNKHIEVIHNILPLLSTIEEGLNHIKIQMSELRFEESLELLQDSMLGIASIDQSLEPILEIPKDKISYLTTDLKNSILKLVENYEKGKQELIEMQIDKELLPAFLDWKDELEITLNPYIIS